MLPLFCLRLSLGLLAALLVLPSAVIHPRFYRTHCLIVLGLCGVALASLPSVSFALLAAAGLAFGAAVVWSVEGAPGGRLLLLLIVAALAVALVPLRDGSWRLVDDLTAAALAGFALTAMLLGHSYLINPSMSLAPLKRLLVGLGLALLARAVLAGVSLALWTGGGARLSLTEAAWMWLPLRWLLGLLVPGVLTFLAWRTTQLRNTQSSTGILYVVVVFLCVGELTAQLLLNETGYFL